MKKDKEWFKQQIVKKYPSQSEIDNPDYEIIAKIEIINEVLSLIDQLDKPMLPEIPLFAAEYIATAKEDNDSLNQAFAFIDDKENKELWDWMFPTMHEGKRDNQEKFARAWLDGYTIKKEKLYQLELISQTITEKCYMGYRSMNTEYKPVTLNYIDFNNDNWKLVFTESEVEKMDITGFEKVEVK